MSHDCSLTHPGSPVCSAGGGIRSVRDLLAEVCEDCEHPCGPGACGCPDECPAVKG